MRIAIIGGSGHVGTYLVPRLIEAGPYDHSSPSARVRRAAIVGDRIVRGERRQRPCLEENRGVAEVELGAPDRHNIRMPFATIKVQGASVGRTHGERQTDPFVICSRR